MVPSRVVGGLTRGRGSGVFKGKMYDERQYIKVLTGISGWTLDGWPDPWPRVRGLAFMRFEMWYIGGWVREASGSGCENRP